MRIVYCLNSIKETGGIAITTITKANALAAVPGNKVFIVVSDNTGKEFEKVSEAVNVIDLGIDYYKRDWKSKLYVLEGIVVKRRRHKKAMKRALNEIDPDIVVSVGQSEKYFLPTIKGRWKTIREIHYNSRYRRFHASNTFERIMAIIGETYDFRFKIKRYDRIVVLTESDRKANWDGNKKVSVIPNPVRMSPERISTLEHKRVIAVGRLTDQKNYASLISSFTMVCDDCPEWQLSIIGTGDQKTNLQSQIDSKQMSNRIILEGNSTDIQGWMSKSSFLAMTSRYEGLPLTILEAFSCGLPVVSFDCPYGPSDLIDDGLNGFLVHEGDESAMAERMKMLMKDETMRKRMGANARIKSKEYEPAVIAALWMGLFYDACN